MTAQRHSRPALVLFLSLLATFGGPILSAAAEEKSAPERLPLPTEIAEIHPRVDAVGDPLPPGVLMRLGSARFLRGGRISDVTYSKDGKRLASACSDDASVRIWDAESGKILHRFPIKDVTAVALSEDGKRWAAVGRDPRGDDRDRGVWVWEEGNDRPPRLFTRTGDAVCLLLHAEQLWIGAQAGLTCWDLYPAKEVVSRRTTRVNALAVSNGARRMVARGDRPGPSAFHGFITPTLRSSHRQERNREDRCLLSRWQLGGCGDR